MMGNQGGGVVGRIGDLTCTNFFPCPLWVSLISYSPMSFLCLEALDVTEPGYCCQPTTGGTVQDLIQ